jgi:hypothetical protein
MSKMSTHFSNPPIQALTAPATTYLSAAVAARGAQIASLHSATPAPRTHEHSTAGDTTSTVTPGDPRPAGDNDMASIGENAILQQLAALNQQMAGFSTAVSPVNPTAATPDPAMLAELQALQHQLNESETLYK